MMAVCNWVMAPWAAAPICAPAAAKAPSSAACAVVPMFVKAADCVSLIRAMSRSLY